MSEASETKPGVWSSLKRILDTLLATAQNRIELIIRELSNLWNALCSGKWAK